MPRTIAKKPAAAKRKAAVPDTTPKRLDRIEEKLEESRLDLARVDEKITTIFNRQGSIETDVKSLTEKIGNGFVEKIFWVVLASAVGFLAAQIGAV
jgi:predicted  nucleic acid-binding Zn-ribbon protein